MALRSVFAQDDDFKESMFARQIAVMKGQAWNVVETLKQPDHGPLELTRRTRVCVWDDLVDVPVAIPMRAPSTERQRNRSMNYDPDEEEEMDIGASASSQPIPEHDLLGLNSSPSDLPNPNRFELTRGRADADSVADGSIGSPATLNDPDFGRRYTDGAGGSLDGWPSLSSRSQKHRKNGGSLSYRAPRVNTFGSDDLEGDLGYAVAEGMEGNQRKVIVERLEAVKSKNPVFTWC
jgi:hypothetical protein